ncbi:hypothetical protein DFS34DRAFT_611827 [Phlyctochytrium arcticum]|nr:hypothetical protein DFS34DRAFT_611827 [Phlyctochytrium arcticum]
MSVRHSTLPTATAIAAEGEYRDTVDLPEDIHKMLPQQQQQHLRNEEEDLLDISSISPLVSERTRPRSAKSTNGEKLGASFKRLTRTHAVVKRFKDGLKDQEEGSEFPFELDFTNDTQSEHQNMPQQTLSTAPESQSVPSIKVLTPRSHACTSLPNSVAEEHYPSPPSVTVAVVEDSISFKESASQSPPPPIRRHSRSHYRSRDGSPDVRFNARESTDEFIALDVNLPIAIEQSRKQSSKLRKGSTLRRPKTVKRREDPSRDPSPSPSMSSLRSLSPHPNFAAPPRRGSTVYRSKTSRFYEPASVPLTRRPTGLSRRPTIVVRDTDDLIQAFSGHVEGLEGISGSGTAFEAPSNGEGWTVESPDESQDEEFFDVDDSRWIDDEPDLKIENREPLCRGLTSRRVSTISRRTSIYPSSHAASVAATRRGTLANVTTAPIARGRTTYLHPDTHLKTDECRSRQPSVDWSTRRGSTISTRSSRRLASPSPLRTRTTYNRRRTVVKRDISAQDNRDADDADADDEDLLFMDAEENAWIDECLDQEDDNSLAQGTPRRRTTVKRTITVKQPGTTHQKGKSRQKRLRRHRDASANPMSRRATILIPRSFLETLAARAGETIATLGEAAQIAAAPVAVAGGGEMAGWMSTAGAVAKGVGGGLVGKFGRRKSCILFSRLRFRTIHFSAGGTQNRLTTTSSHFQKYTPQSLLATAAGALTGNNGVAGNKAMKALSAGLGAAVEGGMVAGVGSLVVSGVAAMNKARTDSFESNKRSLGSSRSKPDDSGECIASSTTVTTITSSVTTTAGATAAATAYISRAAEAISHLGTLAPLLGLPQSVMDMAETAGMVGTVLGGLDSDSDSDSESENDEKEDGHSEDSAGEESEDDESSDDEPPGPDSK